MKIDIDTVAPPAYRPHADIAADYCAAVKALPADVGARACDRMSTRADGRWTLRDAGGAELGVVPPIPTLPMPKAKRAPAAVKAVTWKTLEAAMTGIIGAIAGPLKEMRASIAALERTKALDSELYEAVADMSRRLDALEERAPADTATRGVRWCGQWKNTVRYATGDMVTRDGAVWVADQSTDAVPGASASWSRMFKPDRRGGFSE